MNTTINLYNLNLSIFKKNTLMYLYMYNIYYCCFFKINKRVKIKNKQTLEVNSKNDKEINLINFFIRQFSLCELAKIKFTGKGYKIKKNSKESLILLFNRSHITTIWWKNIFVKKLKKYKIIIKYTTVNKKIIDTILGVRPINIFTKKGLRKSRQILFKKKGKK